MLQRRQLFGPTSFGRQCYLTVRVHGIETNTEGWYLGTESANCDDTCEDEGLRCTSNTYNNEVFMPRVDFQAELEALVGVQCNSVVTAHWSSYPWYRASDSRCGLPAKDPNRGNYRHNCASVASGYQRVCLCRNDTDIIRTTANGEAIHGACPRWGELNQDFECTTRAPLPQSTTSQQGFAAPWSTAQARAP